MKYLNQGFNPQPELRQQFMRGNLIENMFGFSRIAVDQNIWNHTAGVFVGTPTVAASSVRLTARVVVPLPSVVLVKVTVSA